ncbi:hypothetical protein M885DRAFT_510852 [Pelagophyceae sp. CCMP2097]|nr:hypothetical protein M885DRAFT_510852 [Pelagophyceae sp. CCMP2097]
MRMQSIWAPAEDSREELLAPAEEIPSVSFDSSPPRASADDPTDLDEAIDAAAAAVDELRHVSEQGLGWVRVLMAYLGCVSLAVLPVVGVLNWVLVESRRGNLERDWWKCMIHDDLELHAIQSDQAQATPVVVAAVLVQSTLLAWVTVITYQRACIRMEWISSNILSCGFTTFMILLPPYSPAWPAPTSLPTAVLPLFFYIRRSMYDSVPKPNECATAVSFLKGCEALMVLLLLSNLAVMALVVRVDIQRRRAIAADEALALREDAARDGDAEAPRGRRLAHRLLCCKAGPRIVFVGWLVVLASVASAVAHGSLEVICQRAFDKFARPRPHAFGGGTTYVAKEPGLALAGAASIFSFVMVLRGLAADDLANFRIATLLGVAALFVAVPTFAASAHLATQNGLWCFWKRQACVDGYVLGRGREVYGFPDAIRAGHVCDCLFASLYASTLHTLATFALTVAAARTFTANDEPLDAVVMPSRAPLSPRRRPARAARADDATGFEYDLAGARSDDDDDHRPGREPRRSLQSFGGASRPPAQLRRSLT